MKVGSHSAAGSTPQAPVVAASASASSPLPSPSQSMNGVPSAINAVAEKQSAFDRGVARYAAGDVGGAAALWREALSLRPGDERATAYLAWARFRLGGEEVPAVKLRADAGDLDGESGEYAAFEIDLVPVAAVPEPRDSAITRPGAHHFGIEGPDAPVRSFLLRTPTVPNLPPLEVPELRDSIVAALAWPPASAHAPFVGGNPLGEEEVRSLIGTALRALEHGDSETGYALAEQAVESCGALDHPLLAPHLPSLRTLYEGELGDRRRRILLGQAADIPLDAEITFLLSRVDATFSIEDLIDVSGMSRLAAARAIALLLRAGALIAQ